MITTSTNSLGLEQTRREVMLKHFFALLTVLMLSTAPGVAQSANVPIRSPKQVMEEYWKLETSGGRLTTEGWNQAAKFFLRPSPIPKDRVVIIVGKNYSIWEPIIVGDTAEVIIGFDDVCKCQLDSKLNITPSKSQNAIKTSVRYKLVLTSAYWELDPHGTATPKEVHGTPEWRIDAYSLQSPVWLTIDSAIRYLAEVSEHTNDSMLQKNATESLVKLKHFRR